MICFHIKETRLRLKKKEILRREISCKVINEQSISLIAFKQNHILWVLFYTFQYFIEYFKSFISRLQYIIKRCQI